MVLAQSGFRTRGGAAGAETRHSSYSVYRRYIVFWFGSGIRKRAGCDRGRNESLLNRISIGNQSDSGPVPASGTGGRATGAGARHFLIEAVIEPTTFLSRFRLPVMEDLSGLSLGLVILMPPCRSGTRNCRSNARTSRFSCQPRGLELGPVGLELRPRVSHTGGSVWGSDLSV